MNVIFALADTHTVLLLVLCITLDVHQPHTRGSVATWLIFFPVIV